jgi:AraC-like DNA-binding protein
MKKQKCTNSQICQQIVRAKIFMDEYCLDDLDTGLIARKACLSRFHFLRLFKLTYGLTPHQYLTGRRIGKAKELFRAGESVTAICRTLGFDSLSSFNKLFRRYESISPSLYRRRILLQQHRIVEHPLEYVPQCFIEYLHWDK